MEKFPKMQAYFAECRERRRPETADELHKRLVS